MRDGFIGTEQKKQDCLKKAILIFICICTAQAAWWSTDGPD